MKKIALLDYKIGNVKSISNALENLGGNVSLTSNKDEILNSDGVILPGVGAFSVGMKNLEECGLIEVVNEYVKTGKPFLGICLGMQMLLDESEEFGITKGLGLIKGKVIKLPVAENSTDKLPHISWNEVTEPAVGRWKNTILEGTPNKSDCYFVHTFVAAPSDEKDILSITPYGGVYFCSSVQNKNVYGTQFHPEKSGTTGLNILHNFLKLL
jgi:glutamine amidotransferase